MDERERMREVLAERGMGWTLLADYDDYYGYGEPAWFWMGRIQYPQSQWDPFNSWEQAGLVIEAMLAKGWTVEADLTSIRSGSWVTVYRDIQESECGNAGEMDWTVPKCISVAIYRALEATDGEP